MQLPAVTDQHALTQSGKINHLVKLLLLQNNYVKDDTLLERILTHISKPECTIRATDIDENRNLHQVTPKSASFLLQLCAINYTKTKRNLHPSLSTAPSLKFHDATVVAGWLRAAKLLLERTTWTLPENIGGILIPPPSTEIEAHFVTVSQFVRARLIEVLKLEPSLRPEFCHILELRLHFEKGREKQLSREEIGKTLNTYHPGQWYPVEIYNQLNHSIYTDQVKTTNHDILRKCPKIQWLCDLNLSRENRRCVAFLKSLSVRSAQQNEILHPGVVSISSTDSLTIYQFTERLNEIKGSGSKVPTDTVLERLKHEDVRYVPILLSHLVTMKPSQFDDSRKLAPVLWELLINSEQWEVRDAGARILTAFYDTVDSEYGKHIPEIVRKSSCYDKASCYKLMLKFNPDTTLIFELFKPEVFIGKTDLVAHILEVCPREILLEVHNKVVDLSSKMMDDDTEYYRSILSKAVENESDNTQNGDPSNEVPDDELTELLDDAILSISVKRKKVWDLRTEGIPTDDEFEEEEIIDCY